MLILRSICICVYIFTADSQCSGGHIRSLPSSDWTTFQTSSQKPHGRISQENHSRWR